MMGNIRIWLLVDKHLCCCPNLFIAAKASECCSRFWRWQEPAAGGELPAPEPAGVSTELRYWCDNSQLPNFAFSLYHRVGKLCEEHCRKVSSNVENNFILCLCDCPMMICEQFSFFSLSLAFVLFHWHRKGFRVITESEIGLAAIYASCNKYCNPSSLISDSGVWPDR